MKALLEATIGNSKQARNFFGAYRQLTIPMLRFNIRTDKGELFELLDIRAIIIAVQATKRRKIRNLPDYFSGVLLELMNGALFSDAFMDYSVPPRGITAIGIKIQGDKSVITPVPAPQPSFTKDREG